jgi:hypothetical protein
VALSMAAINLTNRDHRRISGSLLKTLRLAKIKVPSSVG